MHKPYQWRPRGRARRYYGQRRGPHAIATPRPSGPRRPGRQHIPVCSGCSNPTDGCRRPGSRSRGLPALITSFTLTERLPPGSVLTEGFARLNAATGIGLAPGYSIIGLAADAAGPRTTLPTAALLAGPATLGQRWLSSPVTSASDATQP